MLLYIALFSSILWDLIHKQTSRIHSFVGFLLLINYLSVSAVNIYRIKLKNFSLIHRTGFSDFLVLPGHLSLTAFLKTLTGHNF